MHLHVKHTYFIYYTYIYIYIYKYTCISCFVPTHIRLAFPMCEDSMRARIEPIPLIFMIILDGEIPLIVASQPLVSLNKVLLNPISGGPGTLGAGRLTSHEFKQRNPRWEKKNTASKSR